MPSDLLYAKLAEALSQPSKAYRAAKAALEIPEAGIEGYKYGADFADSLRKRRLGRQTIEEILGGRIAGLPPELQNTPLDTTKEISHLAPFMKSRTATPSPWSIVSGFTTEEGNPLQENRSSGEVRPVPFKVKGTTHAVPGFSDVDWDSASQSNKDLGKAVYESRVRPSDLGTRDRGIAVKLANEYARVNNLPPLKSYGAEVASKTAKDFATGKPGLNALSLNTALGHANDALNAYNAVANVDARFLNRPINALRAQSNDPNIIQLQTTINALSGELANVFKATGGTDVEIGHWKNVLNENLTPVQAKGIITQINKLLNSRINALQYQRKAGLSGRGEMPLLSPKAAETSRRLSGDDISEVDENELRRIAGQK